MTKWTRFMDMHSGGQEEIKKQKAHNGIWGDLSAIYLAMSALAPAPKVTQEVAMAQALAKSPRALVYIDNGMRRRTSDRVRKPAQGAMSMLTEEETKIVDAWRNASPPVAKGLIAIIDRLTAAQPPQPGFVDREALLAWKNPRGYTMPTETVDALLASGIIQSAPTREKIEEALWDNTPSNGTQYNINKQREAILSLFHLTSEKPQ